jgi:hypothetical protein
MHYHQKESAAGDPKSLDSEARHREGQLAEREAIDDEYKLKFSDFLPLTFVSANNRLESKAALHDLSLSNFSIEDVPMSEILPQRRHAEEESLEDEGVDGAGLSLMSAVCLVQRNFKAVESNLLRTNGVAVRGPSNSSVG